MLQQAGLTFWQTLCEMAPYLLFGFLVAGLLSVFVRPDQVERHLGGRGFWPVAKAALFGVPLPLCSCGVIPVAASLRRHGASRGATTAFLLSTPQTGVDSILVTYGLLGGLIACLRPLTALVTGIVGGCLTNLLASASPGEAPAPACTEPCCQPGPAAGSRLWRALRYGFLDLPREIGRALLVGLAIAGLIATLVPDRFFEGVFGSGLPGMLAMMAVGIPLYVCATGSVPVAAALILKGVSPGVALVFLMTGPATSAATLAIVWKVLGRRTALVYLGTVAGGALAAGWLLDRCVRAGWAVPVSAAHGHRMLPGWLTAASAVLLLALLARSLLPTRRSRTTAP